MPRAEITEQDFQRACAVHLLAIPWRKALGFFPAFPMTSPNVRRLLAQLGVELTGEALDSHAAAADRSHASGPVTVRIRRDDGTVEADTYWDASDVLNLLRVVAPEVAAANG